MERNQQQQERTLSLMQEAKDMVNVKKVNPDMNDELRSLQEIVPPLILEQFKIMILTTTIFVDKTLFLLAFLMQILAQKTFIITRPRRWGKSMLLSMLYCFFTNIQDSLTKEEKEKQNFVPYNQLFEGGDVMYDQQLRKLKKLKIAYETYYYNKYQGKHPVIKMIWSGITPKSFQTVFMKIRTKICDQFHQFDFVKQKLSKKNYLQYDKYLRQEVNQGEIEQKSLIFLSQCLYNYYGRKVVILIDEYDHAYNHMLSQSIQIKERQKTADFLTTILEYAFKHNNEHLLCGVATGIYDILTKNQSGLNTIKKDTIASPVFEDAYGLSAKEIKEQLVDKLFKDQNSHSKSQLDKKELIMKNIEDWYNGYFYIKNNKEVKRYYNSYSVINYLWFNCIYPRKILQPISYWTQTSNQQIIKNVLATASDHQLFGKMFELYQIPGKSQRVKFQYNSNINLSKINEEIESQNYISYLLLHTGYITGIFSQDYLYAFLSNFEIYTNFKKMLRYWMHQKWSMNQKVDLTQSAQVKKFMENIYQSFHKKLGLMNESAFNSLFYVGYMIGSDQTHVVSSQCFTSPNYLDHIYHPKQNQSDAVIIHEFKYQEVSFNMVKMSQIALWQIFQKNYMNLPLSWLKKIQKNSYIKRIIVRGITLAYIEPSGKRQLIIDISPDQEFSIHQAGQISQFFQKSKGQKKKLENLKNQFLKKLQIEKNKRLLYSLIFPNQNQNENEKKDLRSRKKSTTKHKPRCESEEKMEIFERSLEIQRKNIRLDISYQSEEQEQLLNKSQNEFQVKKTNFYSEEKIAQNEVQWEEVNIHSLSEDKAQQLERSMKKVTVEDNQSNISSQFQEEVQSLANHIEQDEIKKNQEEEEVEREKVNLPVTRAALKKRTAKQFSIAKHQMKKNLNDPRISPEKDRDFFNATEKMKKKSSKK